MKLEEIRALIDAATPGPWNEKSFGVKVVPDDRILRWTDSDISEGWMRARDARFIAAARTLMPKLLAVAEAAKGVIETCDNLTGLQDALAATLLE